MKRVNLRSSELEGSSQLHQLLFKAPAFATVLREFQQGKKITYWINKWAINNMHFETLAP